VYIKPGNKSVKDGIDFVKRQRLIIDPVSVNLIKELKSYKWMETINGDTLDQPVKLNDHIVDALRYGIFTHLQHLQISWLS